MDRFPDGLIAFQRMVLDDDPCAARLRRYAKDLGFHA